jgi:hypothetical protein
VITPIADHLPGLLERGTGLATSSKAYLKAWGDSESEVPVRCNIRYGAFSEVPGISFLHPFSRPENYPSSSDSCVCVAGRSLCLQFLLSVGSRSPGAERDNRKRGSAYFLVSFWILWTYSTLVEAGPTWGSTDLATPSSKV